MSVAHDSCLGLHFVPDQPVASTSAAAHRMDYFGAYEQQSTIGETILNPSLFVSAALSAHSEKFNNFNFNFEFPFRDESYHLPPLEPSTLSQFAQPDVAGSSINYSRPSRTQFTTPSSSLWTSSPRLSPVPAPSPPPRPPNPIAAYLDQLPASGSGKRKCRDDDPTNDGGVYARRPPKMPKRSDRWDV
ncbi:hypothetical protein B0H17DRAFT_1145463 [Mycena rosella]|uniref:Uncharacterized protein n=1 Tax=Mycena rosella TaxID=1033263 RepID=A0AAD7CQY4_MYCRO|nr:hypothetical protein B0H17DRAFT_1145463 [Mycena rosella]